MKLGSSPPAARIECPAPAKINLFLHVIGRRDDGYHELQTVFQFLDLFDEIELVARDDGEIRRIGESTLPYEEDLVVRAAKALQREAGRRIGADLQVRKRIPVGAGLGGGSSDAASTLLGLNALWGLGMSRADLCALGLSLGADVPVFLHGHAAWAEGIGERLSSLTLPQPWYLVVAPRCEVSTARIFADPALTRDRAPQKIADLLVGGSTGTGSAPSIQALLERSANDCEAVTRTRYPEVNEVLEWLASFGEPRMTGTGGAVFLPLPRAADGHRYLAELPSRWRGFVCRGRNRSPLLDALPPEQH